MEFSVKGRNHGHHAWRVDEGPDNTVLAGKRETEKALPGYLPADMLLRAEMCAER